MVRGIQQFDKLRKVGAFIENYRTQGAMFAENLDEFDDARSVVQNLVEEYKASQNPEYVDYGSKIEQQLTANK
jgi:tubulin gamma